LLLAFNEALVGLINTLKDFGDITHIEDIMGFAWGRQEVFAQIFE
jgi:hypothetical protein